MAGSQQKLSTGISKFLIWEAYDYIMMMWSAPATKSILATILKKVKDKILGSFLYFIMYVKAWNYYSVSGWEKTLQALVIMRNSMESALIYSPPLWVIPTPSPLMLWPVFKMVSWLLNFLVITLASDLACLPLLGTGADRTCCWITMTPGREGTQQSCCVLQVAVAKAGLIFCFK